MAYETGSKKMFYYIFGGLFVVVIAYFLYSMMTEEEKPVVPEADTLAVVEDTTAIAEEVPVKKQYTAPAKLEKLPEKAEEPEKPMAIKSESLPERSAADLQLVLGQQMSTVQTCFAKASQKDPTLSGKLRYRITVDQSGSAEAVKAVTNETGSKTLESCIATKIKLLRFPKGKEKTTTEYTFSF